LAPIQVLRGDIFKARLSPTEGSEQSGIRPVLVISRDAINTNSSIVVVIPLTDASNKPRIYSSQVLLHAGDAGLTLDSIAPCEQIRSISKTRFIEHLGQLTRLRMASVEAAINITLDLP
jgi:mRNA interferase MazF